MADFFIRRPIVAKVEGEPPAEPHAPPALPAAAGSGDARDATGTVTITTVLGTGPSLTLKITDLTGGSYLIRFDGIPNSAYDIETAPGFNPATWQFWLKTNTDANGLIHVLDTVPEGTPVKFYRAVSR